MRLPSFIIIFLINICNKKKSPRNQKSLDLKIIRAIVTQFVGSLNYFKPSLINYNKTQRTCPMRKSKVLTKIYNTELQNSLIINS